LILIDALYINNSGGKVLLDYLIEEVDNSKIQTYYLLDDRVAIEDYLFNHTNFAYIKASLLNRHKFYKKNQHKFSKVFCFGNLPPLTKLNVPVYTYFHQKLFLEVPVETPLKQKLIFTIKAAIFNNLYSNTDYWLVQTEIVKKDFLKSFPLTDSNKIVVLPFYPPVPNSLLDNSGHKKNNFVYVSTGSPHKNHLRLIEGFKLFYDKFKIGKLSLTIGLEFSSLQTLICKLESAGYPIVNKEYVDRSELSTLYKANEYIIFPSLTESFGLGLLEGMENGCQILGADLPYIYAVCKPSITFNPYSVDSIADAFHQATAKNVKPTEQLVFNQIDKLIELLRNENKK